MRATTFLLAPRSATYRFATSTIHGLPLPQTALHARKQYKIHDKRVQYLPCCAVKSGASANDLQGQAAALLEKQLRLLERERDESLQIGESIGKRLLSSPTMELPHGVLRGRTEGPLAGSCRQLTQAAALPTTFMPP